jgi:hypothetical protein
MNFFRFFFPKKAEENLYLNTMTDILFLNVATVWDNIPSILTKDIVNTYKQDQFKKEKENKELSYYQSFDFKGEPSDITEARINFQGFCLTYYVEDNSYYLSLHLGTSDDFRFAISNSLKNNFKNVNVEDGNFVKGFKFNNN